MRSPLSLVPPPKQMPLSLNRAQCIVHCPWIGCTWRHIADDDLDAWVKLDAHYGQEHSPRVGSPS